MKHAIVFLALVACGGKSAEELGREQAEAEAKARGELDEPKGEPPPVKKEPPKAVPIDAAPLPEPTTPEEVDKARKQAAIDGRYADVVRYCDMMKLTEKSDPQVRLGCSLAACQTKDPDKAKAWSNKLANEYKVHAVKACTALGIAL
jgi:hypothetical protein